MMRKTAAILAMTAAEKADLVVEGTRRSAELKYETILALASLERSRDYIELGYRSVQEFAAARTALEPADVQRMLRVGRTLLAHRELDDAFRAGRLSWSKVRALAPVVNEQNVTEWIGKATRMTSNQLERRIDRNRDPVVWERTIAVNVPEHGWRRFARLVSCLRAEAGDHYLSEGECFLRLLDEVEAGREARAAARAGMTVQAASTNEARHVPAGIRRRAMNRARRRCEMKGCGNRLCLEVHHLVEFSEGGTHALDNLIVLCARCHAGLHNGDARLVELLRLTCAQRNVPRGLPPAALRRDEPGDVMSDGPEQDLPGGGQVRERHGPLEALGAAARQASAERAHGSRRGKRVRAWGWGRLERTVRWEGDVCGAAPRASWS